MAFVPASESAARRKALFQNQQLDNAAEGIMGGLKNYAAVDTERRKAALLAEEKQQERIDKANAAEALANEKYNAEQRSQEFKQQLQDQKIKSEKDLFNEKLKFEEKQKKLDREAGLKKSQISADAGIEKSKNKPPQQPAQNEFQAATFGERVAQAEQRFNTPEYQESAVSRTEQLKGALPGEFRSEQKLLGQQAERNFTNAVLRRESGAAISPTEFKSAEAQYFPRPGDPQSVIEQKARNRAAVIEGLQREGARVRPIPTSAPTPTQGLSRQQKIEALKAAGIR